MENNLFIKIKKKKIKSINRKLWSLNDDMIIAKTCI